MLDPIIDSLLLRFFLALGIGALIGLEREHAESGGIFAGSRTFPLFAVIGAITQAFFQHCYQLHSSLSPFRSLSPMPRSRNER
jgi:MgtC family.